MQTKKYVAHNKGLRRVSSTNSSKNKAKAWIIAKLDRWNKTNVLGCFKQFQKTS
jgi:hypothetical protein